MPLRVRLRSRSRRWVWLCSRCHSGEPTSGVFGCSAGGRQAGEAEAGAAVGRCERRMTAGTGAYGSAAGVTLRAGSGSGAGATGSGCAAGQRCGTRSSIIEGRAGAATSSRGPDGASGSGVAAGATAACRSGKYPRSEKYRRSESQPQSEAAVAKAKKAARTRIARLVADAERRARCRDLDDRGAGAAFGQLRGGAARDHCRHESADNNAGNEAGEHRGRWHGKPAGAAPALSGGMPLTRCKDSSLTRA
jgi:hypothetical protein